MPLAALRSRLRRLARSPRLATALVALAAGVTLLLPVAAYVGALYRSLPDPATADDALATASLVYAADGSVLARFHAENRTWTPYARLSPYVTAALVATEDRRFFRHGGVDVVRIAGAAWQTLRGAREGASTLTMQLARNRYPEAIGRAPGLERKLKEALMALRLERRLDKTALLELYLNTVSFGRTAYGIDAAARTYFGAAAATLDPAQSALLVALLKGPSHYDPVRHPVRARARRDLVLRRMRDEGYLAAADYDRWRAAPLGLAPTAAAGADTAPHFVVHVRRWAEAWAAEHGYDLYRDGLRFHTPLDPALQRLAQDAVAEQGAALDAVAGYEWSRRVPDVRSRDAAAYAAHRDAGRHVPYAALWTLRPSLFDAYARRTDRYRRRVARDGRPEDALAALRRDAAFADSLRRAVARLEAGLVALDPRTGHVLAWVGGRDFDAAQYDHVAQARRQPGSTFKPILYAAALDRDHAPTDVFADSAVTYGGTWRPTNDGGASGRALTLRDGLVYSKNTVAARLMDDVGPARVALVARRLGITSTLAEVPSLALGTSEVTLLEMAGAYAALAAGGARRTPVVVTRVEDRAGRVLARFGHDAAPVLAPHTAYTVVDLLRDAVDRGTGRRLRTVHGLRGDVAGKTGTTQDNRDGWFLALHPQLVVGAWVGFDDPRLTFRTDYWGQGGHNALDVVGTLLRRAEDAGRLRPDARFAPPPGYRSPTPEPTDAAPAGAPVAVERYPGVRSGVRDGSGPR